MLNRDSSIFAQWFGVVPFGFGSAAMTATSLSKFLLPFCCPEGRQLIGSSSQFIQLLFYPLCLERIWPLPLVSSAGWSNQTVPHRPHRSPLSLFTIILIGITYLFRFVGQILGLAISTALLQGLLTSELRRRIQGPGSEEVSLSRFFFPG